MTALTAARNTPEEEMGVGETMLPMADNVKIWKGGMVAVNTAGLAQAAADTAGWVVAGIALDSVDNTVSGHSAGTWPASPMKNWIRVRFGIAAKLNASGLTQAKLLDPVYVTDDNTVGLTSTNGVLAGYIIEFHSSSEALIFIPPPIGMTLQGVAQSGIGGAPGGSAGQLKVAVVALAGGTDTGGGVGSWANPEAGDIWIERAVLSSKGSGGHIATAACNLDVGTTATNATTASDNLIDGQDVHTALVTVDNLTAPGANGKSGQDLAAAKWVTVSMADAGASAGFVGELIIAYRLL